MGGWNAMMKAPSIRSAEQLPRQLYVNYSSDSELGEDDDDDVQDAPRPAACFVIRSHKDCLYYRRGFGALNIIIARARVSKLGGQTVTRGATPSSDLLGGRL